MKAFRLLSLMIALTTGEWVFATVYQVGPGRPFTVPSAVAGLVNAGDTVEIDAGTYTGDVAVWYDDHLVLRGVGSGYARLDADGNSAQGKAIWVIKGDYCVIENIEFLHCVVPDHNGAGIRQEGKHVQIRHCYFHHNEMGILAGDYTPSHYLIEYCEFAFNGYGDGYSHNVYINHIDTLVFQFNYSHDPTVGHALKSRARHNYILYNRITEENGDGSYSIDIPNGGETILIGNIIEQGPNSQNSTIISYGAEGITNPVADFVVVNNTIVNNKPSGTLFYIAPATQLFFLYNNLMVGNGNTINGAPAELDSLGNIRLTSIAAAQFTNPLAYDFGLSATSPAIDQGVEAGAYMAYNLQPDLRYLHPTTTGARIMTGSALDVGAYEFIGDNCFFAPVISGETIICADGQATYSVPALPGSTYWWTVTGGVILFGQGTHQITVSWNNGALGTVEVVQVVP